jgi:hypothetical protein
MKAEVKAYKYKTKNKRLIVGKYLDSDRFCIEFKRLAKDVEKDSQLPWKIEGKIATVGFGLTREAAERIAHGLNKLLRL